MQNTPRQNEKVKHGVKIPTFLPQTVEHRAQRIGHAARNEEYHAPGSKQSGQQPRRDDDTPAHAQITDHGNLGKPCNVNGVEYYANHRHAPDHAENGPAEPNAVAAQGDEGNGGVSARNEHKNRTVVDHLKDALGIPLRRQAMINARHRIQRNQRESVNRAADHAVPTLVKGCLRHAQHQRRKAQRTPHDVRRHIENFFAARIIRQTALPQRGPFPHTRSYLSRPTKNMASVPGPECAPITGPT